MCVCVCAFVSGTSTATEVGHNKMCYILTHPTPRHLNLLLQHFHIEKALHAAVAVRK